MLIVMYPQGLVKKRLFFTNAEKGQNSEKWPHLNFRKKIDKITRGDTIYSFMSTNEVSRTH